MNIQQNVSLQAFNTLGVQAYAEYMAQVNDHEQILELLQYAQEARLQVKILGGGSNVVLPDKVTGLVIQYTGKGIEILSEESDVINLRIQAGYNWHELVMHCLSNGWYGLENLAYIPGSVGAAPVQNIGAYGVEIKEFIQTVAGVYLTTGELFQLNSEACQFGYRESIFKQALDGKVLITHVDLRLSKTANVKVDYAPLNQMAEDNGLPTPEQLAQWVINVRKSKLPDPAELPNAGSFFKNPVISKHEFQTLIELKPGMPHFDQPDGIKVPAGWLIDQLGLKGKSFGPVSVHKHQALVLVNNGGSGEDVLAAASNIKAAVKSEYGIELEQEPRIFA